MADHEESYFLKYLFSYLSDSSLPAIFLLTPVPARLTDKRLMDKHSADKQATDKHRLGSAIRNGRLPREYIPPQVTDNQTQRQPAPTSLR